MQSIFEIEELKSGKNVDERKLIEVECNICFNFMMEPVSLPKCGHKFCIQCISKLFKMSSDRCCPLCRGKVLNTLSIDKYMIDKSY